MDRNDLKEYLEIVIDMENNIQLQEKTISYLRSSIDTMKLIPTIPKPVEPEMQDESDDRAVGLVFLLIGILLLKWGISSVTKTGGVGFFSVVLVIPAGLSLAVMGLGFLFNHSHKDAKAQNERAKKSYTAALAQYEFAIGENERLAKQNGVKISAYVHELNTMQRRIYESKVALERIYSTDIIWHKYRNLPMLCSLYEYIASGRADSLDGKDGAYNILELEMRLDKLIIQMDKVISHLNEIRQNQYKLYSAINECNNNVNTLVAETKRLSNETLLLTERLEGNSDELSKQLRKLNENSAVSAYYNKRAAKELHYMNQMNYLAGRNDGTIFNRPPRD